MRSTDNRLPTIEAHAWMRMLRFECYHVAELRRLRIGEQLWVAYFAGTGVTKDVDGHCEAYFERVRGGYTFSAIWTIQWSIKTDRAHVITYGKFDLLPGNVIQFASASDMEAERFFRTVCRYAYFINRHAKRYVIQTLYLAPSHCHALWRGMTVLRDGCTRYGVTGPTPRGLGAIVETAMALGIFPEHPESAGFIQ